MSFGQQTAPSEPLMGSEASPGELLAPAPDTAENELVPASIGGVDGVYRILVIGDGLAGGFGAGVTRMAEDDQRFEIVNRFNEASGLARPELYDWSQAAPKILATKEFDAVLIHVGVNDRQAMRSADGPLAFQSGEWKKTYQQQVEALLNAVNAVRAELFWVALPPMEEPAFDSDMQYLNGIYRSAVEAKGGVFIDLRRVLTAPDGSYLDRGPDETGVDRKLRSKDGIAFLKQGNNRMGQLIFAAIKNEIARGNMPVAEQPAKPLVVSLGNDVPAASVDLQPAPKVDPAPANDTLQISVTKGLPQFGQQGLEGEEIAFTPALEQVAPAQTKPSTEQKVTKVTSPPARKMIIAQSGSAAESLFTLGLSPDPVMGRFDDFGTVAAP